MKNIVVAGAGLVGCLIAVMLKKRGHNVILVEKRQDFRKGAQSQGRSINLVITSRGLNALKKADLLQQILPFTVPVTGRMIHIKTGEQTFQAYGRDPSECNYSVSRLELNKLLADECTNRNIEIRFSHEISGIDLKAKQVNFHNANRCPSLHYDVLLSTDGAGSAVRESLRTQCDGDIESQMTPLSVDYKELHIPADLAKPILMSNALHIWPRGAHMLMALPNRDGSYTVTLYLPKQGPGHNFAQLDSAQKVNEYFASEFPDALPLLPSVTDQFHRNPQSHLGTLRCAPWVFADSVALMGDAAHAIVPFFGQGMNLGFEDCVCLCALLDKNKDDWTISLNEFDREQRPNANAIAEMALENFVEMSDKVGDPHFLQLKKIEAKLEAEFPDIYRSRYGMITYTLIPYRLAMQAGRIQNQMLDRLRANGSTSTGIDINFAKHLLESEFVPFLRQNQISLERFRF